MTAGSGQANGSDVVGNSKPTKSGLSGKGILISAGRLWRFITVEPLMLCWLLPSCFLFIAVENLALEKVRKVVKKKIRNESIAIQFMDAVLCFLVDLRMVGIPFLFCLFSFIFVLVFHSFSRAV